VGWVCNALKFLDFQTPFEFKVNLGLNPKIQMKPKINSKTFLFGLGQNLSSSSSVFPRGPRSPFPRSLDHGPPPLFRVYTRAGPAHLPSLSLATLVERQYTDSAHTHWPVMHPYITHRAACTVRSTTIEPGGLPHCATHTKIPGGPEKVTRGG
jgi:hypothetical protein